MPSGTLKKAEQIRLGVFKSKILRIFGPYKNNETGEWSKRHNQKLQNLFQHPSIKKKYLLED